jgi:penicillin-binding protein 1C
VLDDLEHRGSGIVNADEAFLGPMLPRVALANSRNVPAVDLLERLGRLDEAYAEFSHAASLASNARERDLLLERMAACGPHAVRIN